MLKTVIKFIHNLKVFFLAFIFLSFFNILGANPIDIGKFLGANFSQAVGVSASIPENPFNKLALQLKNKENNLLSKEEELSIREQALNEVNTSQDRVIYAIGAGVVILFFLVVVNFIMDYKRKRRSF